MISALVLSFALAASSGTTTPAAPAISDGAIAVKGDVDRLAQSLAKDGLEAEAEHALELLVAIGAEQGEVAKVREKVVKRLEKSRGDELSQRSIERHAQQASKVATQLARLAEEAEGADGEFLRRLALRFDGQCAGAREAIGHTLDEAGRWHSPEELAATQWRHELDEAMRRARAMEFEIDSVRPREPVFEELYVGERCALQWGEFKIETYLDEARMRGLLHELLQASAVSNWMMTGTLEPDLAPGWTVHVPPELSGAMRERLGKEGRLDKSLLEYDGPISAIWASLPIGPGWTRATRVRVTGALRAELLPSLLILYDRGLPSWDWDQWNQHDSITPIWQVVGHYNFIAQVFLGAQVAQFAEKLDSRGTASSTKREGFRLGSAGIVGCREWLRQLARKGDAPPISRTVVNDVGRLNGEPKLKAISAAEFLYERGRFADVFKRYARLHAKENAGTEERRLPVERVEVALESTLPEFDEEWRNWLLEEPYGSLRAQIERRLDGTEEVDKETAQVLDDLNRWRKGMELNPVTLNRELSHGAKLHARYLETNPEEASSWPEAHEELASLEGFHVAGSWAGSHSVIAFNGSKHCIEDWLHTFYHRIPLTKPGLLQVGYGSEGDICVLDVTSVVDDSGSWIQEFPHSGQEDVPLAMRPEMPNPVPEREDQRTLGYPVTLQLGRDQNVGALNFTLSTLGGEVVPCFLSTPNAPTNPAIAPDRTWCLLPEAPLKKNTTYRASAKWNDFEYAWQFTTGSK